MSVVSLFRKNTDFSISSIVMDALIEETHNRTAVITENPVEDGSVFNDHIANDPVSVSIVGWITNTPVGFFRNLNNIINPSDRVSTIFDDLNFLYQEGIPFQLVTNLKVYEDMGIQSLTIPKDVDSGNAFEFTMECKKIVKVSRESTQIPKTKVGGGTRTKAQAQSKVNGGKKSPGTAPAGASSTEKAKSILKGFFG